MKYVNNKIFKIEKLPCVELRYIQEILSCAKKHQHSELTITAIKSGNINIIFNDKSDSLKPNEISVVNPNEVHCATLSNVQSLGCYVLYLDKDWCENIQHSLFGSTVNFLEIRISLIQDSKIYNDFISLCNLLFMDKIPLIEKEENLINFISSLFLEFTDIGKVENNDTKNLKIALKIQSYLEENVEDEILLEAISKHMNLSVVHILRIFKQEFGLPIHSYLLNQKVHFAKDLLRKNIPISEIAQMSGFFDQSHLNKSFKRVFQLTPKEYQKNIL